MYAETSSQGNYNVNFDLVKTVPAGAGEEIYGISFQYHLFGTTLGTAVLESSADGKSWS